MDRLFGGLMTGAIVGALLVTLFGVITIIVTTRDWSINIWHLAAVLIMLFLLFALIMPLAQAPLWFLMRALRLWDWAAATIAGGLAFAAPATLFALAWSDYAGPAPMAQTAVFVASCGVAGAIAGFVAWRVASLEIS
jgi:hypothetical protein